MITTELTKLIADHLSDVVEQQKAHDLEEADLHRRQKELDVRGQELAADLERWKAKKAALAQHVDALHSIQQFSPHK